MATIKKRFENLTYAMGPRGLGVWASPHHRCGDAQTPKIMLNWGDPDELPPGVDEAVVVALDEDDRFISRRVKRENTPKAN